MSADQTIDFARQALLLGLLVAAPVMLIGFIVALIVGIVQSATQINEQTISFVPKLAAMALIAALFLPWMISRIMDFAAVMFVWR